MDQVLKGKKKTINLLEENINKNNFKHTALDRGNYDIKIGAARESLLKTGYIKM